MRLRHPDFFSNAQAVNVSQMFVQVLQVGFHDLTSELSGRVRGCEAARPWSESGHFQASIWAARAVLAVVSSSMKPPR